MAKIQLIADPEYLGFFTNYLSKIDGVELTGLPEFVFDTTFLDSEEKIESLSKLDTHVPIITNTLALTASAARQAAGTDKRVIGMPIFPHYFERQKSVEYCFPVGTEGGDDQLTNFLGLLGKTGERVGDSVGGVFPRALAMVINEAAFAVQESVATPKDIDTAMKLGTNYPKGPLAWCDEIGAVAIVAVLDALAKEYGSDRYRVASLLRRHAEGGLKFIGS